MQASKNGETSVQNISPDALTERPIRIGFLGHLFKPPRVPGLKMVEIICQLRATGYNVELHVFGHVSEQTKHHLHSIDTNGLVLHGNMPHIQSIQKVAYCDYLLLLLGDLANSRAVMSLKLPQYLLMGKPILGIVPEHSAVADIISKTGTGYVIPAGSDWTTSLQNVLNGTQKFNNSLTRNTVAINTYSWEITSKQWLKVLSNT